MPGFDGLADVATVAPLGVGIAVAKTTAPLPVVPFERSLADGCVAEGTPLVEIALIHWWHGAVND